jgi:hypothetical protein
MNPQFRILEELYLIRASLARLESKMSALDDIVTTLQSDITANTAAQVAENADIQNEINALAAAIAAGGNVDAAAAVTALTSISQALEANTATINQNATNLITSLQAATTPAAGSTTPAPTPSSGS